MTVLSESLTLPCGVELKNRLAKAAMTEGLADVNDHATAGHVNLYRQWAQGGAGLLITGNLMVDHRFLERPGNVVVEDEMGLASLSAWASAATENNTHCWVQISHPGRQCARIVSGEPLAPSDVQLNILNNFAKPRAMTQIEIEAAIQSYANTARIVKKAGFTGVQIHGAHGYLISQFLSPKTNQRTDEWGGDLSNRARFLLDIVKAVRAEVGNDYPVAVKLNSADFQKGGFSFEDSAQVAEWLEKAGIDLLEISGGVYEQLSFLGENESNEGEVVKPEVRESTRVREAYFLKYAAQMREKISIPLMVTGGFRHVAGMEQAITEDGVSMIGLARPLCTVTDVVSKILDGDVTELSDEAVEFRLGRGFLGPTSSNSAIKALNSQGSVAWYYRQMLRLSRLKEPSKSLSILWPLIAHFGREYRKAIARRFRFLGLMRL